MKKYHVTVAIQTQEIYAIEAEDAAAASQCWADGTLIDTDDEALDSIVLSVKEV